MKHLLLFFAAILIVSCNKTAEKQVKKVGGVNSKVSTEKDIVGKESINSENTYFLNNIKVVLNQIKGDGSDFYCKSKILIYKDNYIIDSLVVASDPVGGSYGISEPVKIDDHLVFTKHGNYDGRALIVNNNGKLYNIIGGTNYYDSKKKLLFTIYESDLSGFAVFDLTTDSLKLEMEEIEGYPISFHKAFGERFFMLCSNEDQDNTSVWEIEIEKGKISPVDLDKNSFNDKNTLKTWESVDVYCGCKN